MNGEPTPAKEIAAGCLWICIVMPLLLFCMPLIIRLVNTTVDTIGDIAAVIARLGEEFWGMP